MEEKIEPDVEKILKYSERFKVLEKQIEEFFRLTDLSDASIDQFVRTDFSHVDKDLKCMSEVPQYLSHMSKQRKLERITIDDASF